MALALFLPFVGLVIAPAPPGAAQPSPFAIAASAGAAAFSVSRNYWSNGILPRVVTELTPSLA